MKMLPSKLGLLLLFGGVLLYHGCAGQVYLSLGLTNITTNNTEILITDIGEDALGGLPSLMCHTDQPGCCRSKPDGMAAGEWYYPNGSMVQSPMNAPVTSPFYRTRNAQVARLNLRAGNDPLTSTGSYCCVIPTTRGEMTFCANLVVCPSLTLTNGIISYSDPTLGVGSIAIHSCTPGLFLNPQDMNTRICQSNGMWTGSALTCEGFIPCQDLTVPINGRVSYSQGSANNRSKGTVATYSCDNGYIVIGDVMRNCQQNGLWTSDNSTCELICLDLTLPANGIAVVYSDTTIPRDEGSTATYSCNTGYVVTAGSTVRTCTASGWDGIEPVCTASCPPLTPPSNGQVNYSTSVDTRVQGDTVMYTCNSGYLLSGQRRRTCGDNGLWSGSDPTCSPVDCGSLSAPDGGQVNTSSGTTFNQVAIYSCNEGHILNGDRTRTCTPDGIWTSTAPTCQIVDCGSLTAPVNGRVDTPHGTSFNETATYSCDTGYQLEGSSTRTCDASGEWSLEEPTCKRIICEQLPIEGGTIQYSTDSISSNPDLYDYGTTATYECNTGYVFQGGNRSRTCLESGWNGTAPICAYPGTVRFELRGTMYPNNSVVAINEIGEGDNALLCVTDYEKCCRDPQRGHFFFPDNTEVMFISMEGIYRDRDSQVVRLNRRGNVLSPTGVYRCEIPDRLERTQTIYIQIVTTCDDLPTLPNGTISYSGDSPRLEGTVATHSCNDSRYGPSTVNRTCQSNRTWSGESVICQLFVHLSLRSTTITTNNTEILISHIGEDVPGGLPSLTCNTDLTACCRTVNAVDGVAAGEWYYPDGSVVKRNADAIAAGDPFYTIRNAAQVARLTRRISLNRLSPTGSYCCVIPTTGGEMTFCANLVVCPSLTLTNGMTSYSDPTLGVGSIAIHSCTPGLVLNPQDMNTRICQSNGMWTGWAPTCKGFIPCSDLPAPINGSVNYNQGSVNNRSEVTVATYSCDTGYMVIGHIVRSCQQNGLWTSEDSTCELICPDLTLPTNGAAIVYSDTTIPRDEESTATYSCNTWYVVTAGSTVRTCTASGWDGSEPNCTATCPNITLTNGMISYSPNTTPRLEGTSATHSCDTGYELSGGTVRTCQSDRTWSGGCITCQRVSCGNPPTIVNGSRTFSGTQYQDTVTYSCNTEYYLSGSDTLTCQANRNWTTPPTCIAICPNITLTNGMISYSPNTTPRLEGTVATHSCGAGFGPPVINRTCTSSTTWSGEEVICQLNPDAINAMTDILGSESAHAGQAITLVCKVTVNYQELEALSPTAMWLTGSREAMLNLSPLKTSHAGLYICSGTITPNDTMPLSVNATHNLIVKIPDPGMTVTTAPEDSPLYAGRSVGVTCQVNLSPSVDTDVNITLRWIRTFHAGKQNIITEQIKLSGSESSSQMIMNLENLTSLDQTIACSSVVNPSEGSQFILSSENVSRSVTLDVQGVFLMFLEDPILSNGMSILNKDFQVVQCHSDNSDTFTVAQNGWMFPNTSLVPQEQNDILYAERHIGHLALTRVANSSLPAGEYCCRAQDARGSSHTLCVQLLKGTCPDLTLANGAISYSPNTTPRLEGTVATHSCDTGYELSGGTVRTCQSDRTWSGGSITCEVVHCGPPPSISNGSPGTPTNTRVGGTVTYSCNTGYILLGPSTSTCLSTGIWSTLPTCETPPPVYLSLASTNYLSGLPEIPFSSVGEGSGSSLVCHTDLAACCRQLDSGVEGGLGAWHYPNGTEISTDEHRGLYITREQMIVSLNRKQGLESAPGGLYCCIAPTIQGIQVSCVLMVSTIQPEHQSDNIGGVVGGVVALLVVLIIAFSAVLVVYILKTKKQRGSVDLRNTSTVVQQELAVPSVKETSHNEPHTYSTVDATYEEIDPHVSFKVKTDYDYTHNEAYVTTVREGVARESPLVRESVVRESPLAGTGAPVETTEDTSEQ